MRYVGASGLGVGLLGITFGTLYQKKFCAQMDPRSVPPCSSS